MNNIEIGSKVKVIKGLAPKEWDDYNVDDTVDGLEGILIDITDSYRVQFKLPSMVTDYFIPKANVVLVGNIEFNPFAQDSIPIGTVVGWEGKKLQVISEHTCVGCYFSKDNECSNKDAKCYHSQNSDNITRKYILINEQQEEQTMGIILKDGGKYITEVGEVVTMSKIDVKTDTHHFKGSNKLYYTLDGFVYSHKSPTPNNIEREYIEETKQEPEGHIHAELMLEYAKDALVSKEPWKGWQYSYVCDLEEVWYTFDTHPVWDENCNYRRKPKTKTILINGYEVPEPLRIAPEEGTILYLPSLATKDWGEIIDYNVDSFSITYPLPDRFKKFLQEGICHLTKEAAQLHAKALLSFTTTVQENQGDEV